jgi:hypothetical protein
MEEVAPYFVTARNTDNADSELGTRIRLGDRHSEGRAAPLSTESHAR